MDDRSGLTSQSCVTEARPKCRSSFPYTADFWPKDKRRSSGLGTHCLPCWRLIRRQIKNGSYHGSVHAPWVSGMTEWKCWSCKETKALNGDNFPKSANANSGFSPQCKICLRARSKKRSAAVKAEMIAAYGGRCLCCGESEPRFLTIEHTNRDGAEHRKRLSKSRSSGLIIWLDLKRRGWPKDGFSVLCWNCNLATKNGDPCPHEVARKFKVVK